MKSKKEWIIVTAGGWDTYEYKNTKTQERVVITGKKQIWKHGRFNIQWWIRYLFYLLIIKDWRK